MPSPLFLSHKHTDNKSGPLLFSKKSKITKVTVGNAPSKINRPYCCRLQVFSREGEREREIQKRKKREILFFTHAAPHHTHHTHTSHTQKKTQKIFKKSLEMNVDFVYAHGLFGSFFLCWALFSCVLIWSREEGWFKGEDERDKPYKMGTLGLKGPSARYYMPFEATAWDGWRDSLQFLYYYYLFILKFLSF